MSAFDLFEKVSKALTNPHPTAPKRAFDVAELYGFEDASIPDQLLRLLVID